MLANIAIIPFHGHNWCLVAILLMLEYFRDICLALCRAVSHWNGKDILQRIIRMRVRALIHHLNTNLLNERHTNTNHLAPAT